MRAFRSSAPPRFPPFSTHPSVRCLRRTGSPPAPAPASRVPAPAAQRSRRKAPRTLRGSPRNSCHRPPSLKLSPQPPLRLEPGRALRRLRSSPCAASLPASRPPQQAEADVARGVRVPRLRRAPHRQLREGHRAREGVDGQALPERAPPPHTPGRSGRTLRPHSANAPLEGIHRSRFLCSALLVPPAVTSLRAAHSPLPRPLNCGARRLPAPAAVAGRGDHLRRAAGHGQGLTPEQFGAGPARCAFGPQPPGAPRLHSGPRLGTA